MPREYPQPPPPHATETAVHDSLAKDDTRLELPHALQEAISQGQHKHASFRRRARSSRIQGLLSSNKKRIRLGYNRISAACGVFALKFCRKASLTGPVVFKSTAAGARYDAISSPQTTRAPVAAVFI
jgi:hypothetical protein